MNSRSSKQAVLAIWGLVAAFGAIQISAWALSEGVPRRPAVLVQVAAAWVVMLTLAFVSSKLIAGLSQTLTETRHEHRATAHEVEQLEIRNAMLTILARSVDVPLAFHALAQRIARLVECDRVGLALLSENGEEFQTYTARVHDQERRARPRPEIVFRIERTALGSVVRSREPLLLNDTSQSSTDFLDVNVLHTAGFGSALIIPLVSKGRAVGTLNLVARPRQAFHGADVAILLPIAEMLAVAYVAQQLQVALAKYRTMEAMAEVTLSIAADINSALQTIIGNCDLIERGYPDPGLQRDLVTIVLQAQRISGLLERMRAAAHERLKEVAESVSHASIPSSPEAYGEQRNPEL
jgi:GAF domain-containing protein